MTHIAAPAFKHTLGPKDAKVVLVGEAFGEQEALVGLPFIGYSGQELTRMLAEAGFDRAQCLLTNTFAFRPGKDSNDIAQLCGDKKSVGGKDYPFEPMRSGQGAKYLKPEYFPELARLQEELAFVRPNLVVALGATATWALLGKSSITALRGVACESQLLDGQKVIPTYHPSAILRNWSLRPIVIADLLKAKRESEFPDIRRPEREVLVDPSIEEVETLTRDLLSGRASVLSVDIETKRKTITMVGFAWSRERAFVVPFWDPKQVNYWATEQEELRAWACVKALLESAIPKLFQNGLYDIQYLARMGFQVNNVAHDTMLLHHALYPELPKSLGFMGSTQTNEASWKLMRTKGEELKRDE